MCFSATASFTTAAVTGVAGLLCLTRARSVPDALLAVTPLLFGAQQALEGGIWTLLPQGDSAASRALTYAYLGFAQPFWPLYVPLVTRILEPDRGRRRVIDLGLALGLVLSARLTWTLATEPHVAHLSCNHILYDNVDTSWPSLLLGGAYVVAICGPLLASSLRTLNLLGLIVLAGSLVSYLSYLTAFQSVWCYFAACASLVIVGHFHRARQGLAGPFARRPRPATGPGWWD